MSDALIEEFRKLRMEIRALREALQDTRADGAVAISIEDAGRRLGCARTRIFELIRQWQLRVAPRMGRKRMVSVASVELLLENGIDIGPAKKRHRRLSSYEQRVLSARQALDPGYPRRPSEKALAKQSDFVRQSILALRKA